MPQFVEKPFYSLLGQRFPVPVPLLLGSARPEQRSFPVEHPHVVEGGLYVLKDTFAAAQPLPQLDPVRIRDFGGALNVLGPRSIPAAAPIEISEQLAQA
jgi:hypothetical protein